MAWDGTSLRAEIGAEFDTLSFRREDVRMAMAARAEDRAHAARERMRGTYALKKLRLGQAGLSAYNRQNSALHRARKKQALGVAGWRAYNRQRCAQFRARRRADPVRYRAWCERMRPKWREAEHKARARKAAAAERTT
jgi:hypothetical protein